MATTQIALSSNIAPMQLTDFEANTKILCVGATATLTAVALTEPSAYIWTVSNGTQTYQSTDAQPEFVFDEAGIYHVSCRIRN